MITIIEYDYFEIVWVQCQQVDYSDEHHQYGGCTTFPCISQYAGMKPQNKFCYSLNCSIMTDEETRLSLKCELMKAVTLPSQISLAPRKWGLLLRCLLAMRNKKEVNNPKNNVFFLIYELRVSVHLDRLAPEM